MEPYLFGCVLNFLDENESRSMITSDHCTYNHFCDIRDRLTDAGFVVTKPTYTSKSSFFHFTPDKNLFVKKQDTLDFKISQSEMTEILAGFVDTNSKLMKVDDGLKLVLYSWSTVILDWVKQVCGVVCEQVGYSLEISFTNVVDLLGRLLLSKTRKEMLFFLGINEKCIFIKRNQDAVPPSKFRYSDVGYDLSIISKSRDLNSVTTLWDTGIAIKIPFGFYAEVCPRSSLSKSGYMLANSVGIIDRSYRGNIYIALTKVAEDAMDIEANLPWKCCQLIFRKQNFIELEEAETEEKFVMTNRNAGGYGSTDTITS